VCQIKPSPLAAADKWLHLYERLWTRRLDALDAFLKSEDPPTATSSEGWGKMFDCLPVALG
jgi:hypothetical protein